MKNDILDIMRTNCNNPFFLEVYQELNSDYVPVVAATCFNRQEKVKTRNKTDLLLYHNILTLSDSNLSDLNTTNSIDAEIQKLTRELQRAYDDATQQIKVRYDYAVLPRDNIDKIKIKNH